MNQKEWLSDILETATEKQKEAIYKVLAASDEQCTKLLNALETEDNYGESTNGCNGHC